MTYWGLRNYGVDGQLGLEPTLGEHLEVMVAVFREVRRVLKPTGTLWLNYGDCYATSPNGRSAADTKALGQDDRTFRDKPFSTVGPIQMRSNAGEGQHHDRRGGILKAKDLCMVPNRLAIALQEDGWWVRSEIIWAKPNPMPESIKDRPATSHEKIFMLSRAPRYFYDAEAVRQGAAPSSEERWAQDLDAQEGSLRANAGERPGKRMKAVGGPGVSGWARGDDRNSFARPGKTGHGEHGQKAQFREGREPVNYEGSRSLRNYEPAPVQVWSFSTASFDGEFCCACQRLFQGSQVDALHCEKAEEDGKRTRWCACGASDAWLSHFATFPPELAERCIRAGCPAGGRVLDPFGGAGTVGLVADRLGLDCTLIELRPEYAEMTRQRINSDGGLFAAAPLPLADPEPAAPSLFDALA